MTTTGTYAFNPALSSLVLQAFSRIAIRRPEITAQHMEDASNEANFVQVELSNRIPNLWLDELYTQALTAGTASYTLPTRFVAFQAVYLTTTSGGVSVDRLLFPYSVYEYSALPDKTQQAPPTAYWMNFLETPQIYLWPVPDSSATYTLNARMLRQIQDASIPSGTTVDVPYRWLDVYVAKLAHRLARIYKQELEAQRKMDAEEAWTYAATTDQEQVPLYIGPGSFQQYYQ